MKICRRYRKSRYRAVCASASWIFAGLGLLAGHDALLLVCAGANVIATSLLGLLRVDTGAVNTAEEKEGPTFAPCGPGGVAPSESTSYWYEKSLTDP